MYERERKRKNANKNPEGRMLLRKKLTFSGLSLIYNLVARNVSAHIYQCIFQRRTEPLKLLGRKLVLLFHMEAVSFPQPNKQLLEHTIQFLFVQSLSETLISVPKTTLLVLYHCITRKPPRYSHHIHRHAISTPQNYIQPKQHTWSQTPNDHGKKPMVPLVYY